MVQKVSELEKEKTEFEIQIDELNKEMAK